ncbi:ABC transporter permease [Algivirga pacifica]|uniref:FtsX-like permease family protein n=1 Tax=Algivirga pacifica TaxID=1162670 RepID=A0ABP9D7P1_9BACT
MLKTLYLLEYALRSLVRKWKKYVALVSIYAIVVAFFSSVIFFTSALNRETQTVLSDLPEIWVQKLAGGRLVPIEESFLNEVSSEIRGIKKIAPRIWGYNYDVATGAVLTLMGSNASLQDLALLNTQTTELRKGEALCGTGLLEIRELYEGDRFTLQDSHGELQSFDIKGSFSAKSDLLTKDLLILHPDDARIMLGLSPKQVTDIGIEVYNPEETDNIAKKIDMAYSGIRVVTRDQLKATYEALFSWRGGIFIYGGIISLLAFLILAWERMAGLGNEEQKELGILKGIGWEITDVLWVKLWEGIIISLTAALSGILLALVHVYIFQAPLLKPFLIGWSMMYPAYDLHFSLQMGDLAIILSVAIIPYLSATIIPAWKGAITDPADIMNG